MNAKYEELAQQALELSERIEGLERDFDEEEDSVKLAKIESTLLRLDKRKERIEARMEAVGEEEEDKEELEEEQREVCFSCGGTLELLGTDRDTGNDIYQCQQCGGMYEDE